MVPKRTIKEIYNDKPPHNWASAQTFLKWLTEYNSDLQLFAHTTTDKGVMWSVRAKALDGTWRKEVAIARILNEALQQAIIICDQEDRQKVEDNAKVSSTL